jgi:hypothetical protein
VQVRLSSSFSKARRDSVTLEVYLHALLTSPLDGGDSLSPLFGCFLSGKESLLRTE